MPQIYIVIPARFQSTRFPGKPLASIAKHTMLKRVWQIAMATNSESKVIIATDNQKIFEHAQSFGANVVMTPESCRNGTERVFAATQSYAEEDDIILSLQGDAVLTPPWVIDSLIDALLTCPDADIATPAQELVGDQVEQFLAHKKVSPSSGTCVTFDKNFNALYFSKQVIPFAHGKLSKIYRHIGLYAYRNSALQAFIQLPPSPLEKVEKLEQLRALENGKTIKVVPVDYRGRTHASVDTPEDLAHVEAIIQREGELVSL